MKIIPVTSETSSLARRIVWFEEALEDMARFMAYAYDDLRDAIDHAPPGIVDPRSWAYWNSKLGRYPAPPMPTRRLG